MAGASRNPGRTSPFSGRVELTGNALMHALHGNTTSGRAASRWGPPSTGDALAHHVVASDTNNLENANNCDESRALQPRPFPRTVAEDLVHGTRTAGASTVRGFTLPRLA